MVRKPIKKKSEKTSIKKQLEEKEKLLQEETKKVQEYIDHLQRLQAEFDNYRKRTEQEKQLIIKQANQELIQKFLTILDSFELALKTFKTKEIVTEHAKLEKQTIEYTQADAQMQGMKLIFSELYSILEKEGLKKIDCAGKKFDPNFHEVMLQEESDKEEGTILEELQKGYMLNDKVIRFSKVKVSKEVKKNE